MGKKQKSNDMQEEVIIEKKQDKYGTLFKSKNIKDIIAPSGIDASNLNHLEIISHTNRLARSFYVSTLPRMGTFPLLLRDMYEFGDMNISVFINPIQEATSTQELNRTINELETERLVALGKGNINREAVLAQKKYETEKLRDEIAAGFNKMFEASVVATMFAYNLQDLDKYTKMLTTEMSKTQIGIKSAWAMQEEAFKSNIPIAKNLIKKNHTFDRNSMATVFPFTSSEVGHASGVPIGYNKQTGTPILFDNFHSSLTNYNMVIFAKSGAR